MGKLLFGLLGEFLSSYSREPRKISTLAHCSSNYPSGIMTPFSPHVYKNQQVCAWGSDLHGNTMPLTQGHSLQGLSQGPCHLLGPVLVLFVPHLMGSLNHPHCLFTVTIPLIFVPKKLWIGYLNSRQHRTGFRSGSTHYHNVTLESLVSGFLSSHLKRELWVVLPYAAAIRKKSQPWSLCTWKLVGKLEGT